MPKYYRFRATDAVKRSARVRDMDNVKSNAGFVGGWVDMTLSCVPSWYLRRTAWRDSSKYIGLPREFSTSLRSSMQFNDRPCQLVVKLPNNLQCQDVFRHL